MIEFLPLLKNMELFKNTSAANLEAILDIDSYNIKSYKKNTVIYLQKENCCTLDIVLEGIVAIEGIDETGNYVVINEFSTGDSLGENLLFSKKSFYPMTISAKTDSTLLHLKRSSVLELCQRDVGFLTGFLGSLSDKTLILAERIRTLSIKSLRNSIIDYISSEYNIQNSYNLKLSMNKKSLAEKFGVQRTSLSRELNKMRDEGLITFDARTITVIDHNMLNLTNIDKREM